MMLAGLVNHARAIPVRQRMAVLAEAVATSHAPRAIAIAMFKAKEINRAITVEEPSMPPRVSDIGGLFWLDGWALGKHGRILA